MEIKLRDYQERGVKEISQKLFIEKNKSLIAILATGGGKTFIFCYIALRLAKAGKRGAILVHRAELLKQTQVSLLKLGVDCGIIDANTKTLDTTKQVYVCMVESLNSRIKKHGQRYIDALNLNWIISDECHRNFFRKVVNKFTDSLDFHIGFTATPQSSNKKLPLNKFYESAVEIATAQELIDRGMLLPSKHYISDYKIDFSQLRKNSFGEYTEGSIMACMDHKEAYDSVINNYRRYSNGEKAVVFNASVAHSIKMTQYFLDAGIKAAHIDGTTNKNERAEILRMLKTGEVTIVNSVGTLTEGFDEPSISTIILNRPIGILSLFVQIVGRGARLFDGQNHFKVLDLGMNWKKFGKFEEERNWLDVFNEKPKEKGDAPVKECETCGLLNSAQARACVECGHEFPIKEKEEKKEKIKEVQLKEYDGGKFPENLRNRPVSSYNIEELEQYRQFKGYKQAWLLFRLESKTDLLEYAQLIGKTLSWANSRIKYLKLKLD